MKSHFLTLMVSALLTAECASGCSDDLQRGDASGVGDREVSLSFSIEGLSLTRSQQDEGMESVIGHAYLLFYPSDISAGGSVPLATVRAEASETESGTLSFRMPLQLLPDTDYRLIAVANADGYVPDAYSSFSDYLAAWSGDSEDEREDLCLFRAAPILARDVESLPMRGESHNGAAFRYSILNGTFHVASSLTFRRMVARIDVASIVKDGFDLEGVALCNWHDAAAINSALQIGNVRGVLSGSDAENGGINFLETEEKSGFQQLQSAIYSFPSVVTESGIGDRESTALIIKAKYADDTESSYYRVNVGANGNHAEVKANTKYLITIQSVKGRGAPTPEEAYSASESQLVTSSVEGWDIDGGCAMDDNGNFIVLSRGAVEFDASDAENAEVKVLTSKDLAWNVDYIPADEASAEAFTLVKVSSSIIISPKGVNTGAATLSGICRVSALTPQGTTLNVDMSIKQKGEDGPVGPVIPWEMPFALVPLDEDRVKIDHEGRTIEIDGFDPDCFNSFIDLPFQVYVNSSYGDGRSVNVSSTLEWPLEGMISEDVLSDYTFCMNSFTSGAVCSPDGKEVPGNTLSRDQISVENGGNIYISVGAMGPDDPAIVREVKLAMDSESIVYILILKPRPVIIDDVVLMDDSGGWWLIMDRNIQEAGKTGVGRDHAKNGVKPQAYHYCNLDYMYIPFKYMDGGHTKMPESNHLLYRGFESNFRSPGNMSASRTSWLQYYKYKEGEEWTSPFYDEASIDDWIFPDGRILGICGQRMRVSKMRMFLVSDIAAKDTGQEFPVCCYWPCFYHEYPPLSNAWYKRGCFVSDNGSLSQSHKGMVYIYCGSREVEFHSDWTIDNDDLGIGRLVRPLTTDELEAYKTNYLGYGSQPLRLAVCHPDTYESTPLGWHPF